MKKGDNYDTAVLVFVMFTVLVNHVFTATYGGAFRFAVLRNWSVIIFYACFMVLTFALLWVDPCDLSCVYRVSCDSGSSLATGSIPFVSQFSVGNIGGCFLGPQVHRYQQLGYANWVPSPEHSCLPPQEALATLPYDSPEISALGYDGPNNAFSTVYRIFLTVLLAVTVLLMHLFVKVGLLGPGAAFFRSRARLAKT
ncbi:hypothetical protein Pmar_PMAR006272 [Perkinsus marinus ATCC 50983]|uniref:Uncharacterized protein n=1 Tax=Perkinsus marinus (strain ATCC 50983 / TXsc) TaxID=423536 RepID=C5LAK5_PERM5|nr:hypothetical protein Pmar_PMAR006272 [Perkinsus marinus ATCC 50983]EER06461.1 hypothetical protein Pmar_PMAR006272 [Perkinsus marinus ATCC 50983]|eukprot:XP_002774645.1 hypothetical protein Pmar_PMAR006272 [Perkinsus marinus ATCC 50983]